MTREEFKKLCYEYQDGEFSDGFDAYGLVNALGAYDIEFDDLNSHESVKEWFKYCIEEEYNICNVNLNFNGNSKNLEIVLNKNAVI